MCVHIEIKSDKNGLVTFYKIFFCVQHKKVVWDDMRVRKWWQNLLAVTFQQSSSKSNFTVKCFSVWWKCIIKCVVFVVNSVISISIRSCPSCPFIYSNWRPYDPLKHSRGIWGQDGLNLVNVILWDPHSKFSAQGPEFLATALGALAEKHCLTRVC